MFWENKRLYHKFITLASQSHQFSAPLHESLQARAIVNPLQPLRRVVREVPRQHASGLTPGPWDSLGWRFLMLTRIFYDADTKTIFHKNRLTTAWETGYGQDSTETINKSGRDFGPSITFPTSLRISTTSLTRRLLASGPFSCSRCLIPFFHWIYPQPTPVFRLGFSMDPRCP